MIDWLTSKVAMTLAALLMLAGVVGFFTAQREHAVQDALEAIARAAAAVIDEVSRSTGDVTTSLSVGPPPPEAPDGLALPSMAAGGPYSITLHATHVAVESGDRRAMAGLREPVHLWRPVGGSYTAGAMAAMDSSHPALTIGGGWVTLARLDVAVDGETSLETFLFA